MTNRASKPAAKPKNAPKPVNFVLTWTDLMDDVFWACFTEMHDKGKRLDIRWKLEAWKECIERVQEVYGREDILPEKKVRDYIDTFKKFYKDRTYLIELSGFRWNETTQKVTAPDEVWDTLLDQFPKYKWYRTHPITHVDDMEKCFGRRQAVSTFAIGINSFNTNHEDAGEVPVLHGVLGAPAHKLGLIMIAEDWPFNAEPQLLNHSWREASKDGGEGHQSNGTMHPTKLH